MSRDTVNSKDRAGRQTRFEINCLPHNELGNVIELWRGEGLRNGVEERGIWMEGE